MPFSLISGPPPPRSVMGADNVSSESVGGDTESTPQAVALGTVGSSVEGQTTTAVEMPSVVLQSDHRARVADLLVKYNLVTLDSTGKQYRADGPVGALFLDKDGNYLERMNQDMANRGEEKLPFMKVSGVYAGTSKLGVQVSGCGTHVFQGVGRRQDASGGDYSATRKVSRVVAMVTDGIVYQLFVNGRGFNNKELRENSGALADLIFKGEGMVETTWEHIEHLLAGLGRPVIGDTVHKSEKKGLLMDTVKRTSKAAIRRRDTALATMLGDIGLEPVPEKSDDPSDSSSDDNSTGPRRPVINL